MRIAAFIAVMVPLAAFAFSAPSAQTESGDLKKTVDGTVDIQRQIKSKQDGWAAERAELIARYRTATAHVEYLENRKTLQEKEALALEAAVAEIERRLQESDRLNASLEDTLSAIVMRLETWIDHDVPFLPEERVHRVNAVKDEMAKPDVNGAEKLRRVLEALQVEAQYGETVEVHTGQIEVGGEKVFVDLLRIGRVSVFWRTPDGKRVGEFDRGTGQWVELPRKYSRTIGLALEMASRMRPVEIISLPLGRITP